MHQTRSSRSFSAASAALGASIVAACGGAASAPEGPLAAHEDPLDASTAGGHAADGPAEPAPGAHHGHMDHRFTDPEAMAARWNDPSRDAWQSPTAIVAAMDIAAGATVADLGTGTGYFLPHLARAVGDAGRVVAVDIEPAMLAYAAEHASARGLSNVDTVLATPDDPHLDDGTIDRILTVNTWHHFADRAACGRRLYAALRPGGSLWVVDFLATSPHGPPPEHRIPAEVVVAELQAAGFEARVEPVGLENQFVVVGRRVD